MKFVRNLFTWSLNKKKLINSITIDRDGFRQLTSKGKISQKIFIDGKEHSVNVYVSEVGLEEMSSIICENYYKKTWRR